MGGCVKRQFFSSKQTLIQDTDKNRVSCSVRNLFPKLALETLFTNFDEDAKIGALANLFGQNYKSLSLVRVGVPRHKFLTYLANPTTNGKYLLPTKKGKHCIAVDCDHRIIMESDPEHPVPLF